MHIGVKLGPFGFDLLAMVLLQHALQTGLHHLHAGKQTGSILRLLGRGNRPLQVVNDGQQVFHELEAVLIGMMHVVDDHEKWSADIEAISGQPVNYPLIGDPNLEVVKKYEMLPASEDGSSEGRTAADNATARSVFLIGPDKKIKATLTYPMSSGRNFHEILRLLDSCQLTAQQQVATPANWEQGEDVVILPSVSDEEAKSKYPEGWEAPLPYIRLVSS